MMDVFLSESDWESISESGSSEDQEETEYLYSGQARNILSSLEESIEKIDDFLSFERGFFHGDLVCSVTDPSGQMGRVVGVDMLVDLESVKGKILKNVNSQTLSKIRSISVGDYVVCGPWLGRVDKVVDKVTVIFDDGSKCEVTAMDQEKLLPLSPHLLDDSQYPYYPGQRVRVGLLNVSKPAKWLCNTWRRNQDEGTVFSVEAGLVYVDWLASAPIGCDSKLPAPPCLQDSKNLTLLACFPYTNWQLGDWCLLPSADSMGVMDQTFLNTSTGHCIKEHENFARGFQRTHLSSNVEEIFVIVKTRTKVDVVWQDGSHSFGLDSQNLLPISVVNTYEFCPEQFVLEKGTFDDPHMSSSRKWGVVLSADAKERTVKVQWKILAMTEANNLDGDGTEETLSAYELIEHPDFSYCFGDVVFRLIHNHFGVPADKDHVNSETGMSEAPALKGDNCSKNQNQYLSCIGLVTGFKDGAVEVKWATGSATKVAPYEIFRIDKVEDSTTTHVLYEENVEESNQEIIEHEKRSHNHKGKDLFDSDGSGENYKRHSWEFSSFFLPKAAIGFFTSIAASLFGSVGSTSLSCPVVSGLISEDGNESGSLHEKEVLETCDLLHTFRHTSSDHEVEETLDKDNDVLPFSTASENSDLFRQFDMVGDCSDHHFLGAGKRLALSQVKSSWLKKIQQEWSILEKNLPETIYVRVFEERMDLLQAAIVGAPGTPYHDGLFFFDISLPLEYPHEPPSVHYNSGGLRVNPNLYESGKVCLSLLNTWTGTGSEAWNPGGSTILQVLLSLQALVLNEKPYFNEAGYDKQIGRAEGEKNSVSYNENAFLGTCKSMLYLLQKPPKNFEALVEEHFRRRSQSILMACKAYMEGAPVGCALGCGNTEGKNLKGSSTGFKIMLAKLLPKLAEAFSGQGMDCSKFIEPEK